MIVFLVFIGIAWSVKDVANVVDLPVGEPIVVVDDTVPDPRELCIRKLFANGVLPKCTEMEYNRGCSYTLTADCDAPDYCELVAGLKQEKCLFSQGYVEATRHCLAAYDDECLEQLTGTQTLSLAQRFVSLFNSILSAETVLYNRAHKEK